MRRRLWFGRSTRGGRWNRVAPRVRLCVLEVELLEDRTLLAPVALAPILVPAAPRAPAGPPAPAAAAPAPQGNPGAALAPEAALRQSGPTGTPERSADAPVTTTASATLPPGAPARLELLSTMPGAMVAEDQDRLLSLNPLDREAALSALPVDLSVLDRAPFSSDAAPAQATQLLPLPDAPFASIATVVPAGDQGKAAGAGDRAASGSLGVVGLGAAASGDSVATMFWQWLAVAGWDDTPAAARMGPWESAGGGYADFVMGLDAALDALPSDPTLPVAEGEAPAAPE